MLFRDVLPIAIIFDVCTISVELMTIFWGYVVLTRSPKEMFVYRVILSLMALADFGFSVILYWIFKPQVIFPIPAAIVHGVVKYFPNGGGLHGMALTMVTAAFILMLIDACALTRLAAMYNKMEYVTFFMKPLKRSLPILFIWCSISVGWAYAFIYNSMEETEIMVQYIRYHNLTSPLIEQITPDMYLIGVEVDKMESFVPIFFMAMYAIIGTQAVNIGASYAAHRKMKATRHLLSETTIRLQRGLLRMILIQMTYPFVGMCFPALVVAFGYLYNRPEITGSIYVILLFDLVYLFYPLINACACLFSIRPYRNYIIGLMRKAPLLNILASDVTVVATARNSVESSPS